MSEIDDPDFSSKLMFRSFSKALKCNLNFELLLKNNYISTLKTRNPQKFLSLFCSIYIILKTKYECKLHLFEFFNSQTRNNLGELYTPIRFVFLS